jgi:hypothetical protein
MKIIKLLTFAVVVLVFGACASVKPSSMSVASRNNASCRQNVADGIVSILKSQGVNDAEGYVNRNIVQTVMTMSNGQCVNIQTPNCLYDILINNIKGEAYLTLFRKTPQGASKTQTSIKSKGFSSFRLEDCTCN